MVRVASAGHGHPPGHDREGEGQTTMEVLDYLRALVALTGPSGAEGDVIRALATYLRPLVDTVEMDALGNLIATRQSDQPGARRLPPAGPALHCCLPRKALAAARSHRAGLPA